MIQKLIIIFLGLFFTTNTIAQSIYVTDALGNPIPNVFVFNQSHQGLTNDEGIITVPIIEHIEMSFQHISYGTITYTFVQIQEMDFKISLKDRCNTLETVELVGRTCQKKSEIFQQLESIPIKNIAINQAQSTPELLERHSGVFMQKSQMGGGSPVVRGFEANKILLVQDGVRLNNAIYRSGHLHNILSIDDQALEKIDLIYGPGALNYGSDAIGGVLHFVSKEPKLNDKSIHYYSSYATANNGTKSYIDFNLSNSKIASLTSIGFGSFGDLKTGKHRTAKFPDFGKRMNYVNTINGVDTVIENTDPNIQVGTGYQQWNISNKTRYIISDQLSLTSNIQYSSSSDIPRYDFLTEVKGRNPKYAEWKYGPQDRIFAALTLDYYEDYKMFDQVKTIFSVQKLKEERISRKFQKANRNHNVEDLIVYGLTVDFIKNLRLQHKLSYGIDLQFNDVTSSAFSSDMSDNRIAKPILTRYPNGKNNMTSSGVYLNYFIQDVFKNIHSNFGVRYQHTNVNIQYIADNVINWPVENYAGLHNSNDALTGAAAIKWEPTSSLSLNWMSATAFRAPNIDDIAKIRVKKGDIQMPNVDLSPEKSLSHELSAEIRPFKNKENMINFSVYHTKLRDAIVRGGYLHNNSDTYISDNDTLHIIANINASEATVKGISISTSIKLSEPLSTNLSFTKVYGSQVPSNNVNGTESAPLAHIPPAYGKMNLIYKKEKLVAQVSYHFYDNKTVDQYGDSSDNLDSATEDGTPRYHLFYVEAAYNFHPKFNISLGLRNILDTHYRMFSSGVSGEGRNIVVSVNGTL